MSTYMKGYMCISASKVYMNLAAAKLRRDTTCGNNFSGLHRSVCRVRLCKRHESSSEFASHTHHPRHFERGKVQLVQSVFIVWSLFLWAFSVPFLIWCLDVVLHYREGFGEISWMFKVTSSTFIEGGKCRRLFTKGIFLFDVHISVLCLLQLCTVKCSLFKMKFS